MTTPTDQIRETLLKIFGQVAKEREYQIARWGTETDSKVNKPNDWVAYITNYASRWLPGKIAPYSRQTLEDFRESMVKVATLAFAAIEETDKILHGFMANPRPDILDPDDNFETSGVNETTNNIPLAIVASELRNRGHRVMFATAPVIQYRNDVVEMKTVPFTQDYSIFEEHDHKIIFLYALVDNRHNHMANECNDIGLATRVRFGIL